MKKKFLTAALLTFAALTLVVVTVFVTLAFLADFSAVSNTFTVGSVGIDMTEAKVNIDGTLFDAGATRVDSNSYHLVPNETYIKDPTIFIDKTDTKDDMYLFVKSSNQIRAVEAGNIPGANGELPTDAKKTMREQMEANGWVEFIRSGDGVEIVWVYGTRDVPTGVITPTPVNCDDVQKIKGQDGALVDSGRAAGEFKLCDEFTIGNVDSTKLGLYGGLTVTFTGFAIQTSEVEATENKLVKASWDSIKDTFPVNCSIINPVNPYKSDWKNEQAYLPVQDVPGPTTVKN